MIHQEGDPMGMLKVVAMLTPDQVAEEILQAVLKDLRDLTLAPNPDIASALAIMKEDPDKAETVMGESFLRRVQRIMGQQGH
jgi:hypothetical protein